MPFTPSHAVVALPFAHPRVTALSKAVPAAIAIGAMTPDLPLFVRGTPVAYGLTHDVAWLPATVAVALVLLLVWRCLLRPAARELSPAWLAARLPADWDAGARRSARDAFAWRGSGTATWRGALLVLASLLIGVLSHIVWDLFTHEGRAGVALLPTLEQQWGPLSGYKWLQHASSAVGLAILGLWALWWLRRADATAPATRRLATGVRVAWWVSLPAVLTAAWVWGLIAYGPLTGEFTVAHLAYRVLPPACAAWGVATLVLCGVVQALPPRESKDPGRDTPGGRR